MNEVIHGEALEILPTLEPQSFDAVITDPPYSSGGFTRSDKAQSTSEKYTQSGQIKAYHDFVGDNRDARSYLAWSDLWMRHALRVMKPHGYILVFSDWRQLPTITDAIQTAGFVWRGVIVWDKTPCARAPHKGYFRHQCEYVVWGTLGKCQKATHDGPFPGSITHRIDPREKQHLTAKPIAVMNELVRCVEPGGRILDPFAGSGTTGVSAVASGRQFVGIEHQQHYAHVAQERLEQATPTAAA